MRERSDINELFRTRLEHAEMDVRDGFWEGLERDLKSAPVLVDGRRSRATLFRLRHWAAAASVLVLLGAASWLVWMAYPDGTGQEPLAFPQQALTEVEEPLQQEDSPLMAGVSARPSGQQSISSGDASVLSSGNDGEVRTQAVDEQSLSLHVSITIRQRQYGARQQAGSGTYRAAERRSFSPGHARWTEDDAQTQESSLRTASVEGCAALLKTRDWALKASLGTSLPKGRYHAPLTAGLSVERSLTKRLSLEAGVQYSRLVESTEQTLHTLGIPVKLNVLLAQGDKVDFYAQVGGMVEKCVAGASDNSFRAEPVQGAVLAGVGVRYKLTDRLALFAEPSVSHHFASDSSTRTLRTERPVNANLLCGLRMTY